jgi:FixJ family two-component response regulator
MWARPIIFLTARGNVETAVHAMNQGAVDFLTKPADGTRLLAAIDEAMRRDAAERAERLTRIVIEQRTETLTAREWQVMKHVIRGMLNKQIAEELGICEKTVKGHRRRVMSKTRARSVPELMHLAARAASECGARESFVSGVSSRCVKAARPVIPCELAAGLTPAWHH